MKTQDDKRTNANNGDSEPISPPRRGNLRVRSAAPLEVEMVDAPEVEAPLDVTDANDGYPELESDVYSTASVPASNGHSEIETEPQPDIRRRIHIGAPLTESVKEQLKGDAAPEPIGATSVLDTPSPSGRSWLTLESGLYLLFFFAAIVTRFWALGDRALHHDESLHATYSWYFFIGNGYTHDPMMHGPFQFHVWGFFYFLLGDSDFSVRVPPAILGIITVMSPFFLRKWVGRGAALMMSFLFLVSPGFLYFSRFAREDAYVMGAESVLIIGLIGFLATRKAGYFYLFTVVLSILFAIKETAYITTFIFFTLFIPLFFWQLGKRYFGLLALYGVAALGFWTMKIGKTAELPSMPSGDNPQLDVIFSYFGQFLGNGLILMQLALFIIFCAVFGFLLYQQRRQLIDDDEFGRSFISGAAIMLGGAIIGGLLFWFLVPMFQPLWFQPAVAVIGGVIGLIVGYVVASNQLGNLPRRSLLLAYPAGSLPQVVGTLLARPNVLFTGVGGFLAIFFIFFTSLFENIPKGIGSGAVGAIGYWISQQPVARGGQPWFYYLLLVPLYEIISVFFSLAAIAYFGGRGFNWALNGWRVRQGGQVRSGRPVQAMGFVALGFNRAGSGSGEIVPSKVAFGTLKPFLILFFIWWLLMANFMYGWAGEKMPWLEVHVDQPAVYLSGIFLAALFSSIYAWHRKRQAEAATSDAEQALVAPETVSTSVATRPSSKAAKVAAGVRPTSNPRDASIEWMHQMARQEQLAHPGEMMAPLRAWTGPGSWLPFVAFIALFVILAFAYMFNMASRSFNLQVNKQSPEWGALIWYPIFMLLLFVAFAFWRGLKNAAQALLVSLFVIMLFYQLRTGTALAYQNGDVAPMEMAVYVQTGHDLVKAVQDVEKYQIYKDGSLDMPVIYDSDFSWPGQWYLRNFSQKRFMPSGPLTANDVKDVPFMFLGMAYHDPGNAAQGLASVTDQYVAQQYVLRWWFDEGIYRNFIPNNARMPDGSTVDISKSGTALQNINAALGSIGTLSQPDAQARLWRYLIYREPYPTGNFAGNSVDFKLYVRKDIYQEFENLANK